MRVTWASSSKTSIFPDRICTRALRMRGSPCFRLFKSALPDAHFRRPRAGRRDVPHPSQSRPRKTPSPSPAFPRGFARPVRTWCTSTTPRAASTPDFRPWAECRGADPRLYTARHANRLRLRPRSYSYVGSAPMLDVFDKPLADWDVIIKLVFDKIVGTIALIVLSPILLATAIAIKLEVSRTDLLQAEALRLQQRTGRDLQVPVDARGQARL